MGQALIKAIDANDVEQVRKLLKQGANVHIDNEEPLRLAIDNRQYVIAELLLKYGADINFDEGKFLRNAIKYRNLELVELLLRYHANVNAGYDNPISIAVGTNNVPLLKLLLKYHANVHADYDGLLIEAINKGYTDIALLLIDADVDIHAYDDYALQQAALNGKIDIVRILLDAGANVHVLNERIFHKMTTEVYTELSKFLQTYQYDDLDEIIDDLGRTKVMEIAQNGPTYKLRGYLTRSQSKNIDKQDDLGNTALIYAVRSDEPLRVQLLLKYRADPFIYNFGTATIPGANAWDYVQSNNNARLKELFSPFDTEGYVHQAMRDRQIPRDIRSLVYKYR